MSKINKEKDINKKMARLTFETYNIASNFLNKIVDTTWMSEKSKLIILGGIVINMEGDGGDQFLPINFEVRQKEDINKANGNRVS